MVPWIAVLNSFSNVSPYIVEKKKLGSESEEGEQYLNSDKLNKKLGKAGWKISVGKADESLSWGEWQTQCHSKCLLCGTKELTR